MRPAEAMPGPSVLEIAQLTVQRERRRLLADVGLTVGRGSLHLLVGPNGAGKSTLFAAVLGLIEFSGSIRFNWRGGGRIGYVPQSFAVDRTLPLTVGEFLALSRQRRPVCVGIGRGQRRRSEELLARVGLAGFAPRPLGALSGGELQRVLLANAMDPVPELLLLDEPASGLDETAVKQLEGVLLELTKSSGTGVLMVSHDLAQVRRVADQVTLLDCQVRRTGTPAAVLAGDLARSFAPDAEYAS
jgi:zinc transport system ATP-binding protein